MVKLIYCFLFTMLAFYVLLVTIGVLFVGEGIDGNAPTFIILFPVTLFLSYLAGRQDYKFALLTLAAIAIATGYCLMTISPINPVVAPLTQGFEMPVAIFFGR